MYRIGRRTLHLKRLQLSPRLKSSTTNYYALPMYPDDLSVMIFGSSTDVGKTIISAGLSIAAMQSDRRVCYIKPVQTGEMDEYFIQLYANPRGINDIFVRTLQHWKVAASPHLAAALDNQNKEPLSDPELLNHIQREMNAFTESAVTLSGDAESISEKAEKKPFTVVETAGGILSPGPNGTLQADLYRALRLPIVLVADGRLGGISGTLSAYESLRLRGYSIHAVIMIAQDESDSLGNADAIRRHFNACYQPLPNDPNVEKGNLHWSLQRAPKVFSLSPIPRDRKSLLHAWFQQNEPAFNSIFTHISTSVTEEWSSFASMQQVGANKVWWPFTHHGNVKEKDISFVESAYGDHYRVFSMHQQRPQQQQVQSSTSEPVNTQQATAAKKPTLTSTFDGSGSWWTQAVGHGNSSVSLAIAEAAGRYGHVLFPRNLHAPSVQLARYMLEQGPGSGWAERVFYADNGSSAMEIALKMACRLHQTRLSSSNSSQDSKNVSDKVIVISQEGGYHGDTLGAMNTVDPSPFNAHQHPWYRWQAASIRVPQFSFHRGNMRLTMSGYSQEQDAALLDSLSKEGEVYSSISLMLDVNARMKASAALVKEYRRIITKQLESFSMNQVGALIIEPVLLGAGGMRFVDPLYQKLLIQHCRSHQIPIVYDEVAVGMYRLGPVSAGVEILQETPDIACYGKMLSGGYLSLALTLATDEVFQAFNGPDKIPLMHGHSYTASPLACAAALETIRLMETHSAGKETTARSSNGKQWMKAAFSEDDVKSISMLPGVTGVMSLGSALSLQLQQITSATGVVSNPAGKVSQLLRSDRVFARPLGADTIYLMVTPMTSSYDKQRLLRVLRRTMTKAFYLRPSSSSSSSQLSRNESMKDRDSNTTIV